jgi:REP element-mobilizing transposase RayT
MTYDPEKHRRSSIRLKDYDYSQAGAYFVTICTHNRECLFGEIGDGEMGLNEPGIMVISGWEQLNERFTAVRIDAYVVMPNHIHGVIWLVGAPLVGALDDGIRATTRRATTRVAPTLGDVVGAFKSITTDEYIRGVKMLGWAPFPGRLWQRNYYEHIIRSDKALNAIRAYIQANPCQWQDDPENPQSRSLQGCMQTPSRKDKPGCPS